MKAVIFCVLALAALASAQSVLDLTDDTFDAAIADKKVLVEFFAPWCGHCKKLAPEYEKAAKTLGTDGILAKVDCTEQKELCEKYGVRGYPSLKFFSHGVPSEYQKGRTAKDIVAFILEQNKPAITDVKTAQEAEAHNADVTQLTVIGFFEGDTHADYVAVADMLRGDGFSFAATNDKEVATHFGITAFPAVVLFKKFDAPVVPFEGTFAKDAIVDFLKSEAFPLVGSIGPDNYKNYVDRGYPLLYILVDPASEEQKAIVEAARKLAPTYKGKLSVVDIDGVQYAKHGESMGLSGTTPDVVLHDMEGKKKFILPAGQTLSEENLVAFLAAWSAGTLTPHLKSQPEPASQTGPVYTLVGSAFERIALDVTKDVLVEFYAPWCGHCKELKPKYDKVGKHFHGDSNIVIAAVDSTENDVPGLDVEGFPTIYFFPASAEGKASPVLYEGERTVDGFIKYINEKRLSAPSVAAAKDEL